MRIKYTPVLLTIPSREEQDTHSLQCRMKKAEFFDGFIRDLLERTLRMKHIMKLALIKRIKLTNKN